MASGLEALLGEILRMLAVTGMVSVARVHPALGLMLAVLAVVAVALVRLLDVLRLLLRVGHVLALLLLAH